MGLLLPSVSAVVRVAFGWRAVFGYYLFTHLFTQLFIAMSSQSETVVPRLAQGPCTARQLVEFTGFSQPTVSRLIGGLGDEVVRVGAARSIQYTLRDRGRGLPDLAIYRVNARGELQRLGVLIPVRPDGFVMQQEDGVAHHCAGLPWWLFDMRPQGYLGRAYAARHGAELGLPQRLAEWNDTHALRALLMNGHDVVGNLLLGDIARERFLTSHAPLAIAAAGKAADFARLASQAAQGETPGSSAGGEQPKFTAFAETVAGPRHVIVKFTERERSPVSERWRDLLLAEHHALETLDVGGVAAARTQIIDHDGQRFLEAERFDRIGALGRRALISLAALDAEFVGAGPGGWPSIVSRLAADGHIRPGAARQAALLWAFGTLIGNTDLHNGNLSFVTEHGRPYDLAPAYDMTPMAFAPRSGGGLPDTLAAAGLHASVPNQTWRDAAQLAGAFLARIKSERRFTRRFAACRLALEQHLALASEKIARLG